MILTILDGSKLKVMNTLLRRNHSIDLMRFIGLTMIVLAHIGLSRDSYVFQLRSFDVPLMIFTSGLAFSGKSIGKYLPFVCKRTIRLVLPIYIFVAIYAALNPWLSSLGMVQEYPADWIVGSFLLRLKPSIGYVWIIRVFLIVMLMTPLLLKLDNTIKKGWCIYLIAGLMLVIQNCLSEWLYDMRFDIVVGDWLLYIFGYPAIFLIGLRFRKASLKERVSLLAVMVVVMFCLGLHVSAENGTWLTFQSFKYPPRAYFLLWGATISVFLWITSRWWTPVLDNRLFTFIGRNTIWIYVWHIPFVNMVVFGPFVGWDNVYKYVFVYGAALCAYGLQYTIVKLIDKRWPGNKVTKYFIG